MAKRFRGPALVKEIEKAMDKGLARFVINTQSKLSAASPVLTGRLASSWFIGMDQPSREVPPERTEPGPVQIQKDYNAMEITMKHNWYISSSLPYTYRAAFDPYNGRRGGGDWFTRIANSLADDAQRSMDYFLVRMPTR